jgi:hypothetical protein
MAEDDPKQKCALLMVKLQSPLSNSICSCMLQRTLPSGFIAPCLPTKTDKLPSGSQWLHEIKHDGFGHRNIMHTVQYTELRSDRFDGFWKD